MQYDLTSLCLDRKKLLDMRWCVLRGLIRARGIPRGSLAKSNEVTRYSQLRQIRRFSSDAERKYDDGENGARKAEDRNFAGAIGTKYKAFNDADVDVILDVTEEQQKIEFEELSAQETTYDPYADVNLEREYSSDDIYEETVNLCAKGRRGTSGVFDIEDLVTLLEKDKAKNIFVASVPKEYAYVDYIVVVTGKSPKHMSVLATFIRKVYKLRRHSTDLLPKIEGKNSSDWIALDLGNIALHIFSKSARQRYDLETLWTVGSQYDDKTNALDEPDVMDQYNSFLAELQPADGQ